MILLDQKFTHRAVGLCIYCGETEGLTKEHTLPLGLGGQHVLPAASCGKCQKIINRSENYCMLGLFRAARRHLEIRSGRRRRRERPLTVWGRKQDGSIDLIEIEDNLPLTLALPTFGPATIMLGDPPIVPVPVETYALRVTLDPERLADLGLEELVSELIRPRELARMLAKIAHAQAVALFGIGGFVHELTGIILGRDELYRRYVGSRPDVDPPEPQIHKMRFIIDSFPPDRRPYLIAEIRLFAVFGSPTYVVLVGAVTSPELLRTLGDERAARPHSADIQP